MRGVLLTILVYLLKQQLTEGKKKELEERIGADRLSEFVKVFELSLEFEAWLNKDHYTEFEVELVERFIPFFIRTVVNAVKREEGNGMKLIKVHLTGYFPLMI